MRPAWRPGPYQGDVDVTPMQAPSRAGLKPRGVLLAGLVALLPLLAFAIFATLSALGSYRASDEARLRDIARALAAAVDAQLGSYVTALQTLATSPIFDGALEAEEFEARARPVGALLGGTIALLGPGPDYSVLFTTGRRPNRPLSNALQLGLAATVGAGKPGISDLFDGPAVPRPLLGAAVPVDRVGQPRRALALTFEPVMLRALLAQQNLASGTFAAVADGQPRILALSSDPEGRQGGVQVPEWIAAAIEGKEQAFIVGPGLSGPYNVYAVERPTRAPGWTVGVYERHEAQQASAWAAVRWLLAGGAALGLGLAVVVWASRREALHDAWRETAALRAGRAEVERLHGGLPAVIFVRERAPDLTSRLIYRGGDVEMVTGWPAATFVGVDNFKDYVDVVANDYHAFLDRVVREGTATVEYRMRQPDGSRRLLRSRCRLLTRRQNGTCEIVGYILDVSAERDAEARAMFTARLASLGEMAAGLAHEMKQPLQAISLAAEVGQIAAARGDTVDVDQRLEQIVEQTQRTAHMIEHLRRFARGAEEEAPPEAVLLTAAVEGALALARSALHDASVSVEVDLGDPPLAVRGQEVLLEQVVTNLLLNARDALAARPAGAPRRIRMRAERAADGAVRLMIADTGGGIAPEIMARLFEPFFTTKGPNKGTGLGLSISHGLIRGMGGSIAAHNDAEGAVFTITLPSAAVEGATAGQKRDIAEPG